LNLLGIDFLPQSDARLDGVLSGLPLDGPSILLSHQPNVLPHATTKNIDLVLSGHLHGGQVKVELLGYDIAPSKIVSPYICGLYRHEQSQMYLSRGLGTTGVPIRLNARPEITEITLVRDTGA
jgi:predicted MPP superfamily phosphohydrolase